MSVTKENTYNDTSSPNILTNTFAIRTIMITPSLSSIGIAQITILVIITLIVILSPSICNADDNRVF